MRFLFYTHSLVSDWNHGNAHFLRGVMRDLNRRGHYTLALEPAGSWSRANLLAERPDALGLAVLGMPYGSPGMGPEIERDAYEVILFRRDGTTEVWTAYEAA